ncbi:MAG TPA: MarR family transcriptional regulator [Caulobacteraceae bacterium]
MRAQEHVAIIRQPGAERGLATAQEDALPSSKRAPAIAAEDLKPSHFERLARFRRGMRQFLSSSEVIAQTRGVTTQQYQAMLEIKARPDGEVSVGDLAEGMLMQHHSAVQLADRLQDAGLVERQRSPTDARSVLLTLTPAGDALVTQLVAEHLRELRRCEPLLANSLRQLRRIEE